MAIVRGLYAKVMCDECCRWIETRVLERSAQKQVDELRDLSRWLCATCEQQSAAADGASAQTQSEEGAEHV